MTLGGVMRRRERIVDNSARGQEVGKYRQKGRRKKGDGFNIEGFRGEKEV